MNINNPNAMLLKRVSPCGQIGQNVLQLAEAVLSQETEPIFALMRSTNKQLHAMHTPAHGLLGLSGRHAVLHVVAVILIETEFTLALANVKNKQ